MVTTSPAKNKQMLIKLQKNSPEIELKRLNILKKMDFSLLYSYFTHIKTL